MAKSEYVIANSDHLVPIIPVGRTITVDKEHLERGLVVPVDAQTGKWISDVSSARIESKVNEIGKLVIELYMTKPYERE